MTALWIAIGVLVVWNMLQAWRLHQLSKAVVLHTNATQGMIDVAKDMAEEFLKD